MPDSVENFKFVVRGRGSTYLYRFTGTSEIGLWIDMAPTIVC